MIPGKNRLIRETEISNRSLTKFFASFAPFCGVSLAKIFLIFAFFLTMAPSISSGQVSPQKYDDRIVKVGLWNEADIQTVRIQAVRGDFRVRIQEAPDVNASGPILSQEFLLEIPETEHVSFEMTRNGLLPKTSLGQELTIERPNPRPGQRKTRDFVMAEIFGGELMSVEVPENPPQILEGRFQVYSGKGKLKFINLIPVRSYLNSTVSYCCPSSEPEAIKALTVAMRTFVIASPGIHASDSFDFCDTSHCQVFKGKGEDRELIKLLAESVKNIIMYHEGKPFNPYFHHTCGGRLSSAKEIFLQNDDIHLAHDDRPEPKGTENCFHSPTFNWVREFGKEEMEEFLATTYAGRATNVYAAWEPFKMDSNGRILEFRLLGTREKVVSGFDFFRNLLEHFGDNSFKSLKLSLSKMRRSVMVRGIGQGHGVGMCIMGADGLSKKGWDYKKILEFYYAGISVGIPVISPVAPKPPEKPLPAPPVLKKKTKKDRKL